jgi:hypothetical protein
LPGGWADVVPVIADFVCEPGSAALRRASQAVPGWQWERAQERGRDELWTCRGVLRDGRPSRAGIPAGADPAAYPVKELLPLSGQLRRSA